MLDEGIINGVNYKNLGDRRVMSETAWAKYPWWNYKRWVGLGIDFSKPTKYDYHNIITFRLWKEGDKGLVEDFCDFHYLFCYSTTDEEIKSRLMISVEAVNNFYDSNDR